MNQKKVDYIPFKQRVSFEERKKESESKKASSPNFIPIILEKHKKSTLPLLPKHKFIFFFFSDFLKLLKSKVPRLGRNQTFHFFSINKEKVANRRN